MSSCANNNEYYVFDRIVAHRTVEGKREYLVKWKDYPMSANTWEPLEMFNEAGICTIRVYEQSLLRRPVVEKRENPYEGESAGIETTECEKERPLEKEATNLLLMTQC